MKKYPDRKPGLEGKLVYLAAAHEVITNLSRGRGEAIMTTISENGSPHATWMASVNARSLSSIITLTSPDSRKAHNLLQNPKLEWMFTSRDKSEVVYLRGEAEFIHDPDTVSSILDGMEDLSRAFFLKYQPNGMSFLAIETKVAEIEYCLPKNNVFMNFSIEQIEKFMETCKP